MKLLSPIKGFASDVFGVVKRHPILFALSILVVVVFLGGFVLMGYRAIRDAIAKVPTVGQKIADALPAR